MKRLLIVLACVGLLTSLGLSHMIAAPTEKILVCHIDEIEYVDTGEVDPITGEPIFDPVVASAHVISVSENSRLAHTGHGDVVVSDDPDNTLVKGDDCTTLEGLDPFLKAESEAEED